MSWRAASVQAPGPEVLCSGLHPSELPFEMFSDRNPLMRQTAELAEQVRQRRRPASPDNPFLQLQTTVSERIIAALDAWRDVRDRTVEQMFLAIYSMPALQAVVGIRASDESPRRQPGLEPERIAFIRERIGEIKTQIAEGGLREAVIRSGVYIGMGGPDVDERAFNQLRRIRAEHGDLTLEQFKRMLRDQFFALILDPEGAMAAIPNMLSDAKARRDALAVIRAVVSAAGEVAGERARRLARIDSLLAAPAPTPA